MKKPTLLPLAVLFLIAGLCLLGCEESSPAKKKDYTVSFDLNGATGSIAPQTIAEGAKVNKPAAPTRDGYTFDDWYIAGATSPYNFDETVKANFTLQARWLSQATDLSLTYDGQAITPIQNNFALAVASTADVAALSLTFTVAAGAQLREGSTTIALSNSTVTKEFDFSVNKTKTFNVRAEDGTTQATYTVMVTVRSETDKEITRFSFLAANNTALSADVEATIGVDTIKAVFPLGTVVSSLTPTIVPTGASTNPETGVAQDFSNDVTYTVTAENGETKTYTVRVRVLQAGEKSYTVRFVTPTDATAVNNQTVGEGDPAQSPPVPSRENYRFDGWYRDANGSGDVYVVRDNPVSEDITLYAKWVRQYTVTFDTDNKATAISAVVIDSATKVSSPEVIPNAGYTFDDWYTSAAKTVAYNFDGLVISDTMLYAGLNAVVYTVNFNSEGTVIDSKTVNEGDAVRPPTNPIRTDYFFRGWYSDETTTQEYDFATATVTADITLYAKWAAAVAAGFLIPDVNFRTYLKEIISAAFEGEYMDTNHSSVLGLRSLDVDSKNISSLAGIEYFTALHTLYCNNNSLNSLDVTQNTALIFLNCYNNSLTALNVRQNTVLNSLYCQNNELTALDVTQNTALTQLNCNRNSLTSLDVTQNKSLTELYCQGNQLRSLNLRRQKRFASLTINAGSTDNAGITTNSLTELYIHEDLQTHDEIKEAKTKLGTAVTISTYDDANTQVCADFDPNDGAAGTCKDTP